MTDRIRVGVILVSLVFGVVRGRTEALAAAVTAGAQDAMTLCISLTGRCACLEGWRRY